jgi:DNA-binding IclR family transcriptional regulator
MTEAKLSWIEGVLGGAKQPSGTQAIGRAFRLFRAVASAGSTGLSFTEVARGTGLARPTAHRMLAALIAEGLVERNVRTGRYVVAQRSPFATPQPASAPLLRAAAPYLDEAAQVIGDTLFLTLRSGAETLCVARRIGSYPVQVLAIDVGARRPMGVSSAGVALLAGMPQGAATRIIRANAQHLAAYGMTAKDSAAAVRDARCRGFALRERGLIPGTKALSVWFARRPDGAAAALTIAGIARRLPHARVDQLAQQLSAYAEQIAAKLESAAAPVTLTAEPDI